MLRSAEYYGLPVHRHRRTPTAVPPRRREGRREGNCPAMFPSLATRDEDVAQGRCQFPRHGGNPHQRLDERLPPRDGFTSSQQPAAFKTPGRARRKCRKYLPWPASPATRTQPVSASSSSAANAGHATLTDISRRGHSVLSIDTHRKTRSRRLRAICAGEAMEGCKEHDENP